MFNNRRAKIIFFLLLGISILIPLALYSSLPQKMATHFNIQNDADGWMNKNSYLVVHFIILIIPAAIFGGMAIFIFRLPNTLLNIPNKDYWLNGTRKEETFIVLQTMLFWLGCLTLLLFDFIFYQVFDANRNGSNRLNSFTWLSIVIYVSANVVLIIKYIIHFNNKEN